MSVAAAAGRRRGGGIGAEGPAAQAARRRLCSARGKPEADIIWSSIFFVSLEYDVVGLGRGIMDMVGSGRCETRPGGSECARSLQLSAITTAQACMASAPFIASLAARRRARLTRRAGSRDWRASAPTLRTTGASVRATTPQLFSPPFFYSHTARRPVRARADGILFVVVMLWVVLSSPLPTKARPVESSMWLCLRS